MAELSIIQKINVSLTYPSVPPIVHAMQYDNGYRTVACNVYVDSELFTVPDTVSVSISATKPDGTYFQYDSETSDVVRIEDGAVYITITGAMTSVASRVAVDVKLVSGDNVIGTFPFVLLITKASVENALVSAGSSSSLLEALVANATQIADAYIDDDGYLCIVTADGIEVNFSWDDEGNVTITY